MKQLPTLIGFKNIFSFMVFTYLKSVAYIQDGILIRKL